MLTQYLHPFVKVVKSDPFTKLYALEKSIGLLSHPNIASDVSRTILKLPFNYPNEAYVCPNGQYIWLLNRLDSITSGILLVSELQSTSERVKHLFRNRINLNKVYYALCFSQKSQYVPLNVNLNWADNIRIDKTKSEYIRVFPGKDFEALTSWKIVERREYEGTNLCLNLVQLSPKTGYTHQLRYQCSRHGFPIVGDDVYGNFIYNREFFNKENILNNNSTQKVSHKRVYLHSQSIQLKIPYENNVIDFQAESDLPMQFHDFMTSVEL
jgi:23S rRNA-/tRNA-specific pseudouridylate synthase